MQQVDVAQASKTLMELIEAAIPLEACEAIAGEEIVITKENQPVVKLLPVAQSKPRPRFGSAKGQIWMSDDFDEPLEDFKDYM